MTFGSSWMTSRSSWMTYQSVLVNFSSVFMVDDGDDGDDGDFRQTSELLKPAIRRQKLSTPNLLQ